MDSPDRGSRPDLMANCAECVGLCCVALAFARSADFAFDKAAGDPCVNLENDYRCSIHPQLRDRGFKGCTVFDCFGAGQKVTRHTFDGRTWHDDQAARIGMFAVFPVMRQLHELLWYLDEAIRMPAAAALHDALAAATAEVEELAAGSAERILATDLDELRAPIAELLREASRMSRAGLPALPRTGRTRSLAPGAELLGADLSGLSLRGAELRGALLIAADLRDADLSLCELIGADLRDADLRGADLGTAIYLTQVQVNAALGDARTVLPPNLARPSHWHAEPQRSN